MIRKALTIAFMFASMATRAQTDLLKELEAASDSVTNYTSATFKGTRIINGHSVETVGRKNLDFIISHRFGAVNSGAGNFFGLDESQIRLALEYGLTDRLMIGVGRSSYQKTLDLFAKYRLLKQSSGATNIPVSVRFLPATRIIQAHQLRSSLFTPSCSGKRILFRRLSQENSMTSYRCNLVPRSSTATWPKIRLMPIRSIHWA